MHQLLVQDPGLSRRFPLRINLPDYTVLELSLIAQKVAMERYSCTLEEGLIEKIQRHIAEQHRAEICTHNASLAVGLVEQAVQRMTCRLMAESDNVLNAEVSQHMNLLTAADFEIVATAEENNVLERARLQEEVEGLIGMHEQKAYIGRLQKRVEFVKNGGSPKLLETCMNVVLTGNPGTGKTTFARLMFRTLRAHGVLTKDVFIERNALELKGQYCGQTAPKIKEMFQMAMGGCLFLDEAYALANGDQFSNEAIRMLLTEVENHRTEVLVVLAGYEDKMMELLRADPGLARRFPTTLALEDYAPNELAEIACKVAKERFGIPFEDGLETLLGTWIEKNSSRLNISNHNGGLAVNLTEDALGRMAERAIEIGIDPRTQHLCLVPSDFGLSKNVKNEEETLPGKELD
jgi:DNA replication protein DnaC